MAQSVTLAVIGMPGHGKSTLLNALINKRGEFKVGSGGGSCTQEVRKQEFDLEYEGQSMRATLIDTMGFPDPDPKNAAAYYDRVVQSCNSSLNAIVWLVRCERKLPNVVAQYKVLMREFNNAKPPIIMVVNGMENYEDDDDRDGRKKQDLANSFKFGEEVAEAAGVVVTKIISGAEKADLKAKVKTELAVTLAGTTPKPSTMKTFSMLEKELNEATDAASLAALETRKQQDAEAKKQQNIKDLHDHIETLQKWRLGTCWVPLAGWVAAGVLTAKISAAQSQLENERGSLTQIRAENAAAQQDKAKMAERASALKEAFFGLKKALLG